MGRRSDARERLIDAATSLFHARGYNGIGVEAICRRAGVQKGSFYHFFPSKRDLALAAIEAQWEEYQREILDRAFATDIPPLGRIRRLFHLSTEFQKASRDEDGWIKGCPFGNLALEMSAQDEEMRARVETVFEGIAARLREALEEAAERSGPEGDGASSPSPGELDRKARAVLAYYQGTVLLAKASNDPDLIRRLAHGAVELAGAAPERRPRPAAGSRATVSGLWPLPRDTEPWVWPYDAERT